MNFKKIIIKNLPTMEEQIDKIKSEQVFFLKSLFASSAGTALGIILLNQWGDEINTLWELIILVISLFVITVTSVIAIAAIIETFRSTVERGNIKKFLQGSETAIGFPDECRCITNTYYFFYLMKMLKGSDAAVCKIGNYERAELYFNYKGIKNVTYIPIQKVTDNVIGNGTEKAALYAKELQSEDVCIYDYAEQCVYYKTADNKETQTAGDVIIDTERK